eukprot:TRINITY_DN276_c0_g1_i6.p1 TRINITY_DN276_c0_g1~~TRINITY_DN276_c0_g1_i6.p1  ORF type:complete len:402 (+),score=126.85 TRINITY_DN276_c0_g1_i6:82-1287(+)
MKMMMRASLLAASVAGARLVAPSPGFLGKPEPIQGEYIVVMRQSVSAESHAGLVSRYGARRFAIGSGLKSFRAMHAKLSKAQVEDVLAHPDVDYVEQNQVMRIAETANATKRISCPDTQGEPLSWGQKRTTTQSAADVASSFAHDKNWGAGVNVYVLDTGIRITHEEFAGGRAKWGANFAGGADTDNNGHGTHCAGTIAGKTYGVAKGATVVAVKVLGDSGSGSNAGVISGVEYAAEQGHGIGSMSLGGGYSAALNQAVNAAASAGVLFSNAAGNSNANSCSFSPASAEDGVCVGSTELASMGGTQVDSRSSFSNYGSCNDVFAPGSSIIAAYRGADDAYATLSGTSMACPHVSAAAAIALQENPNFTPAQVKDWIKSHALTGLVENAGTGTPNVMLHLPC